MPLRVLLLHVASCMFLLLSIVGCSGPLARKSLLDEKLDQGGQYTDSAAAKRRRLNKAFAIGDANQNDPFDGFITEGNDQFTASPKKFNREDGDTADVTLNFVDAPVASAAKAVLGDALGLNYSVDPRVQGTVTLEMSVPVTNRQLLTMFESALRDQGATIIRQNGRFKVIPLAEAQRAGLAVATEGNAVGGGTQPNYISLRYVSAAEMQRVLEPMLPQGSILRVDEKRNALIVLGSAEELAAIRETVSVFDVDWMKGMSFALVPVRSSSPAAIVADLEQVFETKSGILKGVLRFVPNVRLKSVLVISSRAKYLNEATSWIKKLDVLSESNEQSLHVYQVQNRSAAELAKVLTDILRNGVVGQVGATGAVAPKFKATQIADAATDAQLTGGPETPEDGIDSIPQPLEADRIATAISGDNLSSDIGQVRVVADDANNSLLIFATLQQYDKIKLVLDQIDSVPNQVLLEAIIAEVTLDDDLRFGVRWFLGENANNRSTFSDAVTGAVASSFPGFSYFLKSNDLGFTLNAISSVTDVRVLSAPSLVVLDNKSATLQVGDQVPIVTQSAKGTAAPDAPIVSNVELKDTGVILRVTPRVNDSGLVTLDIEQEVSSVVRTTTSGIDSPTIRQRKMKTSVVVSDSEALALGGLIQERENNGQTKVPVLGDIPFLGTAFRTKTNVISRTELIIFIRPRVIRDIQEARRVTEEFRKELSVQAPRVRREEPTAGEEFLRIIR